jgi:hypothetical protein
VVSARSDGILAAGTERWSSAIIIARARVCREVRRRRGRGRGRGREIEKERGERGVRLDDDAARSEVMASRCLGLSGTRIQATGE